MHIFIYNALIFIYRLVEVANGKVRPAKTMHKRRRNFLTISAEARTCSKLVDVNDLDCKLSAGLSMDTASDNAERTAVGNIIITIITAMSIPNQRNKADLDYHYDQNDTSLHK